MNLALAAISSFLLISLVTNAYLTYRLRRQKQTLRDTYDVQMLLHDLTAGTGIVKIERIAPANVLLRAPRDI